METKQAGTLLDAQELAAELKIHRNKVYRMIREGLIPAYAVAGVWRFDLMAVKAALRREEIAS